MFCSIGWGCRIHQQYICRRVRLLSYECLEYDIKLYLMIWSGVIAKDRVLSMGQIELFDI